MNKSKRAELGELELRHNEVHAELRRAIEERDRAVMVKLEGSVIARRNARVCELEAELSAIDLRRDPLLREAERGTARWKEGVALVGSVAGILLAVLGIAKAVLGWLLP